MYYELALISVAIGGGYWGWHFVRQEHLRVYGVLNLIAALLCVLGFAGERSGDSSMGIPGAIGVGAGLCLLVLGPIARSFAGRAARAERFTIAKHLLDVADILAPGSGVAEEKALLGAMRDIRDGNIEKTIDAMQSAKRNAPPEQRHAIDERIAMLYLASYRWDEAIKHAEEHLFGAIAQPEPHPPGTPLRRALGLAPPVWVELLGAYGYTGDLERAAQMLARLEDVCADRPDAGIWLHRGRLIFLALAGRVDAVSRLVERKQSRHMKPAARTYWFAVAHERKGEVAAAEAAYTKARSKSRGRPRVLIDQALARLPAATPTQLGPNATEVVARVEAEPPPEIAEALRQRGPYATRILVVSMIGVAVAVAIAFGSSSDLGVLVRDGALVRGAVHEGEWWRLVSSVFVHVGGFHLLVNLFGLWFLGRLAEDIFGGWRTFAIFALAALGGTVASFIATPVGVSAGASGGIFGLLGAVFVELTWQRKHHRAAWSRVVWRTLLVIAVAQIGAGFMYKVTDQWAHGGGLLVGALAGLVLSPHVRAHKVMLHVARMVSVAFFLAAIVAGGFVARTSIVETLTRGGLVLRETSTVRAVVPASWQRTQDELFDPEVYMVLLAQHVPVQGTLDQHLDALVDGERGRAKDKEFDRVADAKQPLIPLPPLWHGRELAVSIEDGLGTRQHFRVVVAVRPDGKGVIHASLYIPETIAKATPQLFTTLLGTVQAR